MTQKETVTIEQFRAMLNDQPKATPEIRAFGQLTTIANPAKVEEAIDISLTWGWW
jgi:hypothetical protein